MIVARPRHHRHATPPTLAFNANLRFRISGVNTLLILVRHRKLQRTFLISARSHLLKFSLATALEILHLQNQRHMRTSLIESAQT